MMTEAVDEKSVFNAVRLIESDKDRQAYLDEVCGDDCALKERVLVLLKMSQQDPEFLDAPAVGALPNTEMCSATESVGGEIGPYKIREQIGEGGFGLVFVAEQTSPVRRKVALKVIKPGMDSKEVLARFKAEQQALALMDHPNIARVFDAGTTDSGRPYFVMELVRGIPMVEYCGQQSLDVQERIELFISVCQAVQHAHAKGVIHRDLKPSNVMVAPHDGVPIVKVIDFGVAKAIGQQLTDQTVYTAYAQMIGTPLYMSPEQAEINAVDVDIRSDVYSLGVLLYELLTGVTPFDRERFSTAAFDEIRRIIKEEDPPKPSTRLTTCGELLETVSDKRKVDATKLSAMIAGDLDWIVMKALEKERSRRYQTAGALIDDLQNYLNDDPVEARPPSLAYRARKFIRRNRAAVAIAATLLVAMTVTVIATSTGMIQAKQAAAEALDLANERDAAADALAEESKKLAANLWTSKSNEIQALVSQRASGYKTKVYRILKELVNDDISDADRARLKDMAVACLGDPSALDPIRVFDDFESNVKCIDLTRDGKWLAIKLKNDEVSLINVASGREKIVCPAGADDVTGAGISFGGDSTRLAIFQSKTLQNWELKENATWVQREVRLQKTGRFGNRAVHLAGTKTEDGVTIATARVGLVAVIEKVKSPEQRRIVLRHPDLPARGSGIMRVSIRNDGKLVAGIIRKARAFNQESVAVWDVETQKLLGTRRGEDASFSPDGRWLTVACGERGLEVFDAEYLKDFTNATPIIYRRGDIVHSCRVLSDGRTVLYSGRQSGLIRVWDLSANVEVATLGHGLMAEQVEHSLNGRIVASKSKNAVKLWRLNDLPERLHLMGHSAGARAIDYSPSGEQIATTGTDGLVRLWDTKTGELLREPLKGGGQSVEFSADGKWIAAGSHQATTVSIWRTDDNTEKPFVFDADVGSIIWGVHFCDGDRKLAISGNAGVRLLDFTGDPKRPVQEFASDDETRLSQEGAQHITSNSSRLTWMSHPGWNSPQTAYSVAFSAVGKPTKLGWQTTSDNRSGYAITSDGGFLYTDLKSDQLQQLDAQGRPVGKPFAGRVAHLALHPSRPWVAVSSRRDIQIWDRQQGRRLLTLPNRDRVIWFLDWHPTNNQLAIAYSSGVVELWNIDEVQKELAKLGLAAP